MERRSCAMGVRLLSVAAAVLLWSLAVAPPAFSDRGEGKGGDRGGRPEAVEHHEEQQGHHEGQLEHHEDSEHDDDFESEDSESHDNLRCEGRQDLVRIEEKVCPPNPHRPVIVVKRACCRNPAGKVHCRGFRQCPNRSPS